jgi:hypothetical protein
MAHPWQALAARIPGLTYEDAQGAPILRCGHRAASYAVRLLPLNDRPCVCAVTEAVVWDDLLMTIWRPGALPPWTQRWPHRFTTGDPAFDSRYEVLTLPDYVERVPMRLTLAVRAALMRPPEVGLIVGDYGVFLYLPGLAEAMVDEHLLAVADNIIPVMLASPETSVRKL